MGLSTAVGGFNAPAGTSGSVSVTGLSFQPKVVFLWTAFRTETADTAVADASATRRPSFGMFTATEQYAWGSVLFDAAINPPDSGIHRADSCLFVTSSASYRALVVSSMNADGFTLQISATIGTGTWAAARVHYLALGGTDITDVKIGTVFPASGTGNESFTPLTFRPDALLFPNFNASLNTLTAFAAPSLGVATSASDQWLWTMLSLGGANPTNCKSYLRAGECAGMPGAASMQFLASLVSMGATGWTLNKLLSPNAWTLPYCAIKGVTAKAGTFSAASAGASITGLGFQPAAILFATHGTTQSTSGTLQNDAVAALGASAGSSSPTQLAQHAHAITGKGTSEVAAALRNDGVLVTTDTTASMAVNSRIAIGSHDASGFTYTMPTSTLSGHFVGYLAFGPAVAVTATRRSYCYFIG